MGFWLIVKNNFLIELSTVGADYSRGSSFVVGGIQTNAQEALGRSMIENVQALVRD